jgi:hypothetical protein
MPSSGNGGAIPPQHQHNIKKLILKTTDNAIYQIQN